MPYLIDGHNLIPKMGLRLDSPDDEMELIVILQEFCRLERKHAVSPRRARGPNGVEVYFDGAPTPHAGTRKLGAVTAHFVPLGTTADDAIRNRLRKLGRSAKNWAVVSSDRQVQAEARAAQAEIISSDSFAGTIRQTRATAPKPGDNRKLSKQEIEEWLKFFEKGRQE